MTRHLLALRGAARRCVRWITRNAWSASTAARLLEVSSSITGVGDVLGEFIISSIESALGGARLAQDGRAHGRSRNAHGGADVRAVEGGLDYTLVASMEDLVIKLLDRVIYAVRLEAVRDVTPAVLRRLHTARLISVGPRRRSGMSLQTQFDDIDDIYTYLGRAIINLPPEGTEGAEKRALWVACAETEAAEPGLQMLIDLVDEWRAKVRALRFHAACRAKSLIRRSRHRPIVMPGWPGQARQCDPGGAAGRRAGRHARAARYVVEPHPGAHRLHPAEARVDQLAPGGSDLNKHLCTPESHYCVVAGLHGIVHCVQRQYRCTALLARRAIRPRVAVSLRLGSRLYTDSHR